MLHPIPASNHAYPITPCTTTICVITSIWVNTDLPIHSDTEVITDSVCNYRLRSLQMHRWRFDCQPPYVIDTDSGYVTYSGCYMYNTSSDDARGVVWVKPYARFDTGFDSPVSRSFSQIICFHTVRLYKGRTEPNRTEVL